MQVPASTSPHEKARVRAWLEKLLTFWTLIVIVSAIAIGLFADVGEDVAEHSTTAFDDAVRAWFIAHQNHVVYRAAFFLTWLGSPIVMVLIALGAGAWFYRRRGRSKAGVIVAAPAIGGLVSAVVKLLYGRARPAGGALLNERTFSFPSGHATTSAAVVVTLCYVMARERIISWPVAIIVGATVPLVVGLTRLYLDVHWTTDVVGGWMVGLFVAAISAAMYEYLLRSAPPAVDALDASTDQSISD
jgi:membrane-associated phospholipid phosphatase